MQLSSYKILKWVMNHKMDCKMDCMMVTENVSQNLLPNISLVANHLHFFHLADDFIQTDYCNCKDIYIALLHLYCFF